MIVFAAALLAAMAGAAAETSAHDAALYKTRDCGKLITQSDMNECAGANLSAADAELNRIYAKLMAQQSDQPSKDQLKDLERAWIAYRDKECAFEIGPQSDGGSIWPMAMDNCLQDKADVHIRELKSALDCESNDAACGK